MSVSAPRESRLAPEWRRLEAYPFVTEVALRWSDMDLYGHVNNVKIALIYEEVRVRLMQEVEARLPQPFTPVRRLVAEVRIQYLGEIFYPTPVIVGGRIVSVGNSSYRLGMAMFQDGACVGACDTVFAHREEGRSLPLPQDWRLSLGRLRGFGDPERLSEETGA